MQLRVHGEPSLPVLIYLPGLHGDWTLIGGFRRALGGKVRFVEITYPRTLIWSLDDYAAAVETVLAENGITTGWLLGESFSSQVVWAMVGAWNICSARRDSGRRLRQTPYAPRGVADGKSHRPDFNEDAGLDHFWLRQGGALSVSPFATNTGGD